MDTIDLVMWTLNGDETLFPVLERISEVIPEKNINQKIVSDDGSSDNTRLIAEYFGWTVVDNKGKGISDGANTVLEKVETDFFASFEQDLLLSREWFRKIPHLLEDPHTAVASGVRFASSPVELRRLQTFVYQKYIGSNELPAYLRSRKLSSFSLGKTLDNTLWRTETLRDVGGFPNLKFNAGIDTVLAFLFAKKGLVWRVDYDVKSVHLRKGGLRQELAHQRGYAFSLKEANQVLKDLNLPLPISKKGIAFRLATSPFVGSFIALRTREPRIAVWYPIIRLNYLRGLIGG